VSISPVSNLFLKNRNHLDLGLASALKLVPTPYPAMLVGTDPFDSFFANCVVLCSIFLVYIKEKKYYLCFWGSSKCEGKERHGRTLDNGYKMGSFYS